MGIERGHIQVLRAVEHGGKESFLVLHWGVTVAGTMKKEDLWT